MKLAQQTLWQAFEPKRYVCDDIKNKDPKGSSWPAEKSEHDVKTRDF